MAYLSSQVLASEHMPRSRVGSSFRLVVWQGVILRHVPQPQPCTQREWPVWCIHPSDTPKFALCRSMRKTYKTGLHKFPKMHCFGTKRAFCSQGESSLTPYRSPINCLSILPSMHKSQSCVHTLTKLPLPNCDTSKGYIYDRDRDGKTEAQKNELTHPKSLCKNQEQNPDFPLYLPALNC